MASADSLHMLEIAAAAADAKGGEDLVALDVSEPLPLVDVFLLVTGRSERNVAAIADELAWMRQTPKARQSKSKARIRAFDELMEKQENRVAGKAQILIQLPERLGGKVIEAKGLTKSYGDKLLFEGLDFTLPPGGIVGVIGPNGAGKSTLFKLITGQEQPDAGEQQAPVAAGPRQLATVARGGPARRRGHEVQTEVCGQISRA